MPEIGATVTIPFQASGVMMKHWSACLLRGGVKFFCAPWAMTFGCPLGCLKIHVYYMFDKL